MKLPRHQRSRPAFAKVFERDDVETIAAMDQGGHDIPNQVPQTPLALQRVGMRRRAIPIQIVDPLGSLQTVQISSAVAAQVSLAHDRRGIHVSRIGHLLAEMSGKVYRDFPEYAARLVEQLCAAQGSRAAGVRVEGTLTYLERVSGVKVKKSLEHIELFAQSDSNGTRTYLSGIGFNHLTACPCVQETYRNSFSPKRGGSARHRANGETPLITHTQRCRTRISFSDIADLPPLPELLAAVDSVVVRSQNTLPREFELLNVHRAHARPQFLEDVLRDLLLAVYRLVRPRSSEGSIMVEGTSMESIHDFDMDAEIAFSLEDLDRILAADGSASSALLPQVYSKSSTSNGSSRKGVMASAGAGSRMATGKTSRPRRKTRKQ